MKSLGTYPSSVTKNKDASRTTIPKPVTQALGLEHKEKISWEIFVDDNRDIFVTVKKGAPQKGTREGAKRGAKKA
jgi:bifunctional DNA-binding transcriptional regulator/antitoxin component of YhaV-PrlF toxin-antitoxin module